MTQLEAINYLEHHGYIADDVKDMCIKALEKQIAKKPYRNHRNCLFWTCPTCNEEMYWDTDYGQQKFKNCSNCGQKLDWGNEDAD